jgi:hypothetical protein
MSHDRINEFLEDELLRGSLLEARHPPIRNLETEIL